METQKDSSSATAKKIKIDESQPGDKPSEEVKQWTSKLTPEPPLPPEIRLHRYARVHRSLAFSLFITTLASIVLLVASILVRYFHVEFVVYLLKDHIGHYVYHIMGSANHTWASLRHPLVLEFHSLDKYEAHPDHLGRWSRLYSDLLMTNVLMLWSTGIAGLICLYHQSHAIIMSFILLNIVAMGMEGFAASALIELESKIHAGLENDLVNLVRNEYSFYQDNLISRIFNTVMILGECCGIVGPSDFGRRVETINNMTIVEDIPKACCKPQWWRTYGDDTKTTFMCVKHGAALDNEKIFTQGCFDVVAGMFVDQTSAYVVGFTFLIWAEQVVQICIAVIVIRWTTFVDHQMLLEKGIVMTKQNCSKLTLSSIPIGDIRK